GRRHQRDHRQGERDLPAARPPRRLLPEDGAVDLLPRRFRAGGIGQADQDVMSPCPRGTAHSDPPNPNTPGDSPMSSRTWAFLGIVLGSLVVAGSVLAAQPEYPKVNVANVYQVDPKWPEKPADFKWIEFHGVAVDGKDNVYCFTRGT